MASDRNDREEPINILANLVIGSANDVLAGFQTFEEHEKYLRETAAEYAARGIKLPLELDTGDTYENDSRHTHEPPCATSRQPPADPKLPDSGQGLRNRSLFD